METDETALRRVDPYHLLFEGGQFYLVGYSHERKACASSGSRGSAARSRTRPRPSTTSSAPRTSTRAATPNRIPWQLGDPVGRGRGRDPRGPRLVRRAPVRRLRDFDGDDGGVFRTAYAIARLLISWALEYGRCASSRPAGAGRRSCAGAWTR